MDETVTGLALHEGTPVRSEFLPFHRPLIGAEEEQEVLDALRSGWLTTGPRTKHFEKIFAEFTGAKRAVAVNSCTAAIHLSLAALGVGPGDEVITTPITFASTANVVIHQSAIPVFVDVEPDTLNVDPAKIEEKITPRTKAILPVDFAGQPCDLDAIMEVARKHGLAVIEDAAHAVGARYRNRDIGSIAHTTCFSFYATKNITTGEGGMITTDDEELADKMAIMSLHGISRDAWKRYGHEGYKHWDIIYPGYKYNMFDLQAALGIHQLAKINAFREKRHAYWQTYNEAFRDLPEIATPIMRPDLHHALHLYVILVRTEMLRADRDIVMNAIQAENVGIGIHFRAVHLHPYYRETFGFHEGMFPVAEYASERVISLPLYPAMTEKDVDDTVRAVHKVIRSYR